MVKEKTYDYSVTVTGHLKAYPKRGSLDLLYEAFGMIPVKLVLWGNPGLKANQILAWNWSLGRPVWLLFCVHTVLGGPDGLETGFKGDRFS